MDGGTLAWIIPLATLFGGAVGWYWRSLEIKIKEKQIKILENQIRIQEEQKDIELLKIAIDIIIKRTSVETNPNIKKELGVRLKILDDEIENKRKVGINSQSRRRK